MLIGASAGAYVSALFQDATANALAASHGSEVNNQSTAVGYNYVMAAGTVSSTTFKVRCGPSQAGTLTYNGKSGSGQYGDTTESSTVIITEYMG